MVLLDTTAPRYLNPVKQGSCCIVGGASPRTCLCFKNITFCKGYCDKDDQCKGYYEKGDNKCRMATTADCPESCTHVNGENGVLDPNTQCGTGNGCFIKQPRKEFIM